MPLVALVSGVPFLDFIAAVTALSSCLNPLCILSKAAIAFCFAAAFTAISGASAVLNGSMVTYSNEIKHTWLGVEKEILENLGAVSSQCVTQMLEGIKKSSGADYVIAVSGIAGPTGGSEEKPVGTVYIGLQTPLKQEVFQCLFDGGREQVQEQSTHFAIEKLAEVLNIS